MSPRLRFGVAVAGMAILVFAENLFGRQLDALVVALPGLDKALHVIEYFLVFVVSHALARDVRPEAGRRVLMAVSVGVALSIADELVQQLAPFRTLEMKDLVADWTGLTLGWVAVSRTVRAPLRLAAGVAAVSIAALAIYDTHVRRIDYSRALRYEREQDFVRAREHLLLALDAGMRTPQLYNELGWVEIESGVGDARKAVEYARTALHMQPANADVMDTYGWALHHAGRHAEALEHLLQAYAKKPGIFCIHYHLASTYLALGDRSQAEFHFTRQTQIAGTREAELSQRALVDLRADP